MRGQLGIHRRSGICGDWKRGTGIMDTANISIMSDTVLVAEPNDILRCGLIYQLRAAAQVSVVAECLDAHDAYAKALELQPNVAIISSSTGEAGLQLIRELAQNYPHINCLYISLNPGEALSAIGAGARGFCCAAAATTEQISTAVRSVAKGAGWLDARVATEVLSGLRNREFEPEMQAPYPSLMLTRRELEVLALVVDGLTNQEIADALYLSCETVRSHLKHILEKLRVKDRTQAAVKAIRECIIPIKDAQPA